MEIDWNIFLEIHKDMPRQGSGRDEYTQKAFELIPEICSPKILDIGCGPGMQTIKLAFAISLLVVLVSCSSIPTVKPSQTESSTPSAVTTTEKPGASKRSKENCNPEIETQKYLHLIGKNVNVEILWHDVSGTAKKLRFPFQVTGYTNEGLIVIPHEFPLREQYMALLFSTGHLLFRDGKTVLDTCSAEVTEEDEINRFR